MKLDEEPRSVDIRHGSFSTTELVRERAGAALWRGVRFADGAPVLVKIVARAAPDASAEPRLRHEARVLQSLQAPGVARALGLGRVEGGLALVLEDAPGRHLDVILGERRLDVRAALSIAAEIAKALDAVHRAGFVHRDVEPASVIVDEATGSVKLLDFGSAIRRAAATPPAALGDNLRYVAPEQTGRMERSVDARSDLYMLGVTLYELLTGTLPFPETDPTALVFAHLARVPPRVAEIAPKVPAIVSDIVAKLLAKAPEERYQSAAGLLFDLDVCLVDLRRGRSIRPFVPGSSDIPAELCQPSALHGRDQERAALRKAFDRLERGPAEVALFDGPPGIGKSTLARDFAAEVAPRGVLFGVGKCEQTGRAAPFAALSAALGDLLRSFVAVAGVAELALFREDLARTLGPNAAVLVELTKDAEPLLGPQARAPSLERPEARNRLALVLERTLSLLVRTHPVIVFLDDVQWLDPASLDVVRSLLSAGRLRRCLVALARRTGEAASVGEMLASPEAQSTQLTALSLEPLDRSGTRALVADMTRLPEDRVRAVADAIFARTGGNPLFVSTLLGALHEARALYPDLRTGALLADFSATAGLTDAADVVPLLRERLGRLPASSQRILVFAACLGFAFSIPTLAVASDSVELSLSGTLEELARDGFVARGGAASDVWTFAHDRVQQAALGLVDERELRAVMLTAGRRLRARAGEQPSSEELFVAVDLLDAAAPSIEDPEERATLARDNLRAGRAARARGAFEAGKRYFENGVRLLEEHGSSVTGPPSPDTRALAFELLLGSSECAISVGDTNAARRALTELSTRAERLVEQVRVATVRVLLRLCEGDNGAAIAAGCEALRAVGIELPVTEDEREAALAARLSEGIAARVEPPFAGEAQDEEALAIERLLMCLALPAYFTSSKLYGLVTHAWLDRIERHGFSNISAMGYAHHGAFLCGIPGRSAESYEFGKRAVALLEQRKNPVITCSVIETVGGNIAFHHEPLREILTRFPGAMRAGIDAGDYLHASYIVGHTIPMRLALGDDLAEVDDEMSVLAEVVDRSGDVFMMAIMGVLERTLAGLRGRPPKPGLEEPWTDEAVVELASRAGLSTLGAFRHTMRLFVDVVWGDVEGALHEARAAELKGPYAPGQFFPTELYFFAALARLGRAAFWDLEDRDGRLAAHREELRALAARNPYTYGAKHLLVEAEVARVRGDELSAMRLYDEAIEVARVNEMVRDEALACERAADFHVDRGRTRIGLVYLGDAIAAYRTWGAMPKVRALSARLSRNAVGVVMSDNAPPSTRGTRSASGEASTVLDSMAAVRAALKITAEVALPRVMEELLRGVSALSGAERAVLLVERNAKWFVTAELGLGGIFDGRIAPLDEGVAVAASVVREVARSGEPIVLSDAARSDRFASDPDVMRRKPRSILCSPVAHAGRQAGIVYLESNAVRGAFARQRVGVLSVLLAQAAIAMENAELYERIEGASRELSLSNERLTAEVAARTAELAKEYVAREEAERARAELAEDVVRAQKERIAELSAPLLPIADGVVLVPLVGTMDAGRAIDMQEATLARASRADTRVVLLDVTGMKDAGPEVVSALVRAARALRLLGVETVLTGVSADTARALVAVRAELEGIATRSTLKSGIEYALRRTARGRSA